MYSGVPQKSIWAEFGGNFLMVTYISPEFRSKKFLWHPPYPRNSSRLIPIFPMKATYMVK